ncbi:MAG: hypothetical protein R2737_16100 [Candidatus Nanopelagicales bacterium]
MTTMTPATAAAASTLAPKSADEIELARVQQLLQVTKPTGVWWAELAHRLDGLSDRMWEHRAAVEGPGGLHSQILADEPRLAAQIDRLEREHSDLADRLLATRLLVGRHAGDPRRAATVVTAVADLLARLRSHQRRAREIVYDAYLVDLGGE